jgi:hypothetical protein
MKRILCAVLLVSVAALGAPAVSLAAAPVQRALEPVLAPPTVGVSGMHFTLPQKLREIVDSQRGRTTRDGRAITPRVFTEPCTITGHVFGFDGGAVAGAAVDLLYVDASDALCYVGSTSTGLDGSFQFSAVPETTEGIIAVSLEGGSALQSWGNTFTASGPNNFELQPGLTGVQTVRSVNPKWNTWQQLRVETYGSKGGGTTWVDGGNGMANVLAPDCDYAVAYPYDNQGIEWRPSLPLSVVPGAQTAESMTFDQDADGRSAWISSPYWQSGKAGTKIKVTLANWPAGHQMSFYGWSQAPTGQYKDWPFYVNSNGAPFGTTDLTIPSTAPAGYNYELHVYRYDDQASELDLSLYFQVASLKSSRTWIRRGGAIRLSGVIPTQGHMGSVPGKAKYVTIYRRTTSAGQPTAWDATKRGWVRVGAVRANGYGKYVTSLLRPKRTTWYVVRYPGDNWYHRAFTSVIKVVVK